MVSDPLDIIDQPHVDDIDAGLRVDDLGKAGPNSFLVGALVWNLGFMVHESSID